MTRRLTAPALLALTLCVVARAAVAAPASRDVTITASDGVALKGTYFAAAKAGPAVLLLHMCNTDRHSWDPLATAARRGRHQRAHGGLSRLRRKRRPAIRHARRRRGAADGQRRVARRCRQGVRVPACAAGRRQGARGGGRRQLRCHPGVARGEAPSRGALARAARRSREPRRPPVPDGEQLAAGICRRGRRRPVRPGCAAADAVAHRAERQRPQQVHGLRRRQARHRNIQAAPRATQGDHGLVPGHARRARSEPAREDGAGRDAGSRVLGASWTPGKCRRPSTLRRRTCSAIRRRISFPRPR